MNLGGEHPGNTGKTLRNHWGSGQSLGRSAPSRLQNLSNYPASAAGCARSTGMVINKRVRVVFYALAMVELFLLSALYSWARVAH
jgi:hypothetical protein